MDYLPFNPIVWGAFAGFVIITWASVKLYHKKYPDYPQKEKIKNNYLVQTRDSEGLKTDQTAR
ncbi:MAG: hypothetical protein ABFD82_21695 [Syntrophaceae bacterium]